MKKNAIFIVIFVLSLPFSITYSQEPSHALHVKELIMNTVNGPSEITFNIVSTSARVWEPTRSYVHSTYLTTDKKYVDPENLTLTYDDSKDSKGWDTDGYYPGQEHVLGRGYYRISVWGKSAVLNVDCYGTHFLGDVVVLYDYPTDVFKVNGTIVTEIKLYDDPSGLQPTPPRNFICTNASHVGQHPHFTWSAPSNPTGVTFSYNVYRSLGAGYAKINGDPITNTSYTDREIEIVRNGTNSAVYYATAMGFQSPESEPSNTASIQTNMAEKRILPEGRASENSQEKQREDFFRFSNYPNPFNPTTTISYQLPEAVHVTVAIYDLRGQLVETLVDGEKAVGRYSVQWHAESQPSGMYFYRIQAGRFTATKKLLLLK